MMMMQLVSIQDGAEKSFGLTEGHLSFLNSYGNLLFFIQNLLRNLIGYQTYALKTEENF